MSALADKHAVVTGGGSGIGLSIAQQLERSGAQVTIMGRNAQKLEHAAESMEKAGVVSIDVSDAKAVKQAFTKAVDAFGPVAILVNNAGIAETAPFQKIDLTLWQRVFETNVTGTFLCTQQVYDTMRKDNSGRIINIASTSGLRGYPYTAAYTASKHAVIGLTRTLAIECAGKDVTVNAVCPGFTNTEIVQVSIDNIVEKTGRSQDAALNEMTKYNPQGRLIEPYEVAEAVLWLCSDGAASVTGQSIIIAGGEIM